MKAPTTRRRRFAFLRQSKKLKETDTEKSTLTADEKSKKRTVATEPKTWEDHWVPGDYPFVRLEGNRAACAICLMDYEEPEKVQRQPSAENEAPESPAIGAVREVQVEEITREEADRLELHDAGEGAQPLRLLPCGHVFHVSSFVLSVSTSGPITLPSRKHV